MAKKMSGLSTANMFSALAYEEPTKKKPKDKKNDQRDKQAAPPLPEMRETPSKPHLAQTDTKQKKNKPDGNEMERKADNKTYKKEKSNRAKQYKEWAKKDEVVLEEIYEKDLQEALLLSKLTLEKDESNIPDTDADDGKQDDSQTMQKVQVEATEVSKSKPTSKKTKSSSENRKGIEGPKQPSTSEPKRNSHKVQSKTRTESGSGDAFYEDFAQGAKNIIHQEKKREQLKMQTAAEAKYIEQLEQKDATIIKLKLNLGDTQIELRRIKTQNKELSHSLEKLEVKEKTELLSEVDSLNQVKDDLTSQLTDISQELEKERSKNHSLKNELLKAKGGK